MPHVRLSTGIDAYYRREGEGPPVVLIMGTGLDHRCWDAQVAEFRRSYECIRFDNRGTGRTSSAGRDVSIRLMADDTASLMDELGVGRAHISGLSMGSCIAQELALSRPDLVETLQLHGTWGRAHAYAARKFAAQVQLLKTFDLRAAYEINVLWFLTPDFMLRYPERVADQIEAIVESAPSRDDLVSLYTANLRHDTPWTGCTASRRRRWSRWGRSTWRCRRCTRGRWPTPYPARSWCCSRAADTCTTWRTRKSSTRSASTSSAGTRPKRA